MRPLSFIAICGLIAAPLAAGDDPAGGIFQRTRQPHDRRITFVHRVKNPSKSALRQVQIAVAVPRTDVRQSLRSLELTPRPSRRSVDGWEQETAYFDIDSIPPGGEAEVKMEVEVTLRELEWLLTDRDVGSERELPERVVRHYLRDGEKYKLDEAIVRKAAERIEPASGSMLERVRRIHDLVIDSVEYSRDDRWDSADSVLREGKGSCSEYAYLMIALCRLQGIPARYAGGTWLEKDGVSPPKDAQKVDETSVDRVFHRWVEVYLPRVGWFPVDPTQDDLADREGEPYRYFGRLPWSYFTMTRGDGGFQEGGQLGWEYRSSTRWLARDEAPGDGVVVERFAVWSVPDRVAKPAHGVGN